MGSDDDDEDDEEENFDLRAWTQQQFIEETEALQKRADLLAAMVRGRVRVGVDSASKKFGEQLFDNFCAHPKRKHIAIRNFKKNLPPQLGQALFGDGFPIKLDLSLIERVFPKATKLTLNHLNTQQMPTARKQLVQDVLALIEREV